MSDEFGLPIRNNHLGNGTYHIENSWKLTIGLFFDDKQADAAVVAINAYDANQQEIAELKEMTGRLNEFLVKAFNEYNLTGSLSVKISLQGGTILTESETLLYGSEREGKS
jgi:hypothetical protein